MRVLRTKRVMYENSWVKRLRTAAGHPTGNRPPSGPHIVAATAWLGKLARVGAGRRHWPLPGS